MKLFFYQPSSEVLSEITLLDCLVMQLDISILWEQSVSIHVSLKMTEFLALTNFFCTFSIERTKWVASALSSDNNSPSTVIYITFNDRFRHNLWHSQARLYIYDNYAINSIACVTSIRNIRLDIKRRSHRTCCLSIAFEISRVAISSLL